MRTNKNTSNGDERISPSPLQIRPGLNPPVDKSWLRHCGKQQHNLNYCEPFLITKAIINQFHKENATSIGKYQKSMNFTQRFNNIKANFGSLPCT